VSATEQQLAVVASKCQQLRRRSLRTSSSSEGDSGGGSSGGGAGPDWPALLEILSRDNLLKRVAEAARADGRVRTVAALEAAAGDWLAASLACLPSGTAAVSLGEAFDGRGLMVCRLDPAGGPPLVAVLPPPEEGLAT
jgi:hypothetical protein